MKRRVEAPNQGRVMQPVAPGKSQTLPEAASSPVEVQAGLGDGGGEAVGGDPAPWVHKAEQAAALKATLGPAVRTVAPREGQKDAQVVLALGDKRGAAKEPPVNAARQIPPMPANRPMGLEVLIHVVAPLDDANGGGARGPTDPAANPPLDVRKPQTPSITAELQGPATFTTHNAPPITEAVPLTDNGVVLPAEEDWDIDVEAAVAASRGLSTEELPSIGAELLDPPPLGTQVESPSPVDFTLPSYRFEDIEEMLTDCDDGNCLEGRLSTVVPVRYGPTRLFGEFDAGDLRTPIGADLLVETDRGAVSGKVVGIPRRSMRTKRLRRVIRILKKPARESHWLAVAERSGDRNQEEERAKQVRAAGREAIRRHGLPMKLARASVTRNGNKATLFFSAESRVDFRELVRELARSLRMRIEMRQLGVRDHSKITGGLGPCGTKLCCASFIDSFHPVSIRMAKDQSLALNPNRISGMCGRLKCCLAYEQGLYREARRHLPKVGRKVQSPVGIVRVQELDIPRRLVRVVDNEGTTHTFPGSEISSVDSRTPGT